jgi:hypothetical protein
MPPQSLNGSTRRRIPLCVFCVFVLLAVSLSACRTQSPGSSLTRKDTNDVTLAVLSHMVEDWADKPDNKEIVCFAELPPDQFELFTNAWGKRLQIARYEDCEVRAGEGLFLKNTDRAGFRVRVEVAEISGRFAEAGGLYNWHTGLGLAVFRYKLRFEKGKWWVVFSECVRAS